MKIRLVGYFEVIYLPVLLALLRKRERGSLSSFVVFFIIAIYVLANTIHKVGELVSVYSLFLSFEK